MFKINYNRYPVDEEDVGRSRRREFSPSLHFHILLGTVSVMAFLATQSPISAATMGASHELVEVRTSVPYRRNPGAWEALQNIQFQAQEEQRGQALHGVGLSMPVRFPPSIQQQPAEGKVVPAKRVDLSEWVQVQKSDAQGAPAVAAFSARRTKASYILPAVASTVIKPTGRLLKSTAEGAYYALPHVARAGWWTVCKGFEALGSTLSAIDNAALYTGEAVRDVQAGRTTVEERGWEAGKRTKTAFKSAGSWTLQTATEGVENAASPLWNGLQWAAEETWKNTTIAVKDMREAYLDDLGSAVWSSIKSTAARTKTYIENVASSTASKVKAVGSSVALWVSSQAKNMTSSISANVSSAKAWLMSKFSK